MVNEVHGDNNTTPSCLVQVPEARCKVLPLREDFSALCDPRTAMTGEIFTPSLGDGSRSPAFCVFSQYIEGLRGHLGHLCCLVEPG